MKNLLFLLILFGVSISASAQIQVSQFNAEWNSANAVGWVNDLEDCKTISYTDIAKNPNLATKHKIAV